MNRRRRGGVHSGQMRVARGMLGWSVLALLVAVGCDERAAGPLRVSHEIGEGGLQRGQFSYPRGICSAGPWLAVVDKSARIQLVNPDTGEVEHWWKTPESALGKPTGLGFGPAPEGSEDPGAPALYVADTHYHRVLVYALPELEDTEFEPRLLASFGSLGREDGQFIYLTDVAVLPTADGGAVERIYVGEYGGNDRVSVFDGGMNFVRTIGRPGVATEEEAGAVVFDRPQAVEVDLDRRELVVADSANHRIGRFTAEGELIGWFEDVEQPLNYPYGLAELRGGRWLVAEYGASMLREVDLLRGHSKGVLGEPGRGPGQLATPWGVATHEGEPFVLDSGNNRVLGFEMGSGFLIGAGR